MSFRPHGLESYNISVNAFCLWQKYQRTTFPISYSIDLELWDFLLNYVCYRRWEEGNSMVVMSCQKCYFYQWRTFSNTLLLVTLQNKLNIDRDFMLILWTDFTLPYFRFQTVSGNYEAYFWKYSCDMAGKWLLNGYVTNWFAFYVFINCQILSISNNDTKRYRWNFVFSWRKSISLTLTTNHRCSKWD